MFTLANTPVKFVVLLVFFAWCTAWSVYELTRPQDRTQRVSNVLHLVMSVVMLLMVAPVTWMPLVHLLTPPVVLAVFVLSTAWFVGLAVTRRGARWHYAGHAAMFGAMAWHLVGMNLKMPHMGAAMKPWLMEASKPGGSVWTVALVGIPFMAYLLFAAGRDLVDVVRPVWVRVKAHDAQTAQDAAGHAPISPAVSAAPASPAAAEETGDALIMTAIPGTSTQELTIGQPYGTAAMMCHEQRAVASPTYRLAALAGFAMNLGMFWMSTGLMTPILPWMTHLAF